MDHELKEIRDQIRAIWIGIGLIVLVVGWTATSGASRVARIDRVVAAQADLEAKIVDLKKIFSTQRRADMESVYELLDRLDAEAASK